MGLVRGALERGLRGYLAAGLMFVLIVVACGGSGSADDTTTTAPPAADSTTSTAVTTSTTPATKAPSTTCTTTAPQPAAAASDWATYGFDDANSRHNRAETRIGPGNVSCLEVLWTIDDLGGVTGTPVVVDGVIYFGDWNGGLHAVDAETGAVIWEEQVTTERVIAGVTAAHAVITATALVTEHRVFIPDMDGFLHARDRDTGSAVWTVEVDDQPTAAIIAAPVLVDDMVIVGVAGDSPFASSYRGSVVAVDADTGAELWRVHMTDENSGPGVGVWTAGAVDRDLGLVFFGTGNTRRAPVSPLSAALVAIDYKAGELVWFNQLNPDDLSNADVGASPNLFTIDDRGVVGVGGKNGLFRVVDRQTGDQVWSVQLTTGADGAGVYTTAALGDGVIYVNSNPLGSGDSITFALDMSDGSTLWERPLPSMAVGSLTLANGVVFQGTVAGRIYALDAGDGSVLWSDEMPSAFGDGISVAGGMLFVAYGFSPGMGSVRDGGLVAYSLP